MSTVQKVDNNLLGAYNAEVINVGDSTTPKLRQVVSTSGSGVEATRLDDAGSGITYIGWATPGTATSAASWKIMRMTDSGLDCYTEFADGDSNYDNIWDNRTGLSYS